MLKKTLICKHNVDLKEYCRLRAFLKTNADGFVSKKTLTFTPDEVRKLIVEAPDVTYLAMKVAAKNLVDFIIFMFLPFVTGCSHFWCRWRVQRCRVDQFNRREYKR